MTESEFNKIKFNQNTIISYKYRDDVEAVICSVCAVDFTEIIIQLMPIDDPYHRNEKFYANIKHCEIYKSEKKIIRLIPQHQ